MGRLIEAAIDFKDEQFLIDLSGDVKRGLKDLVEKYGCVPGPAPGGLKREKVVIGTRRDGAAHVAHRWIPDPDIAPRVLRAFEMRAQRLSLGAIQNETRFYSGVNSYRTFFSNPIYKGALQYAELFIDDYCDPIVSKELWDQVQAIQNHYQHRRHTSSEGIDHPRRANSRFLLSGIGKCGHCGSPLYGRSTPQKSGKSYDSYLCTRAYRKRDCTRSRIPRAAFEDAVIATLTDYILTPETFAAAYTELQNSQKGRLSVEDRKRRELTTDLGKIRRRINNIANSIAEIGGSKSLHTKLQDLEIQETNIQSQLAKLESNADQPVQPISPEVIQANAAELLTRFQSAHESDCLRQIRFIGRSSTSRSSQTSSPG